MNTTDCLTMLVSTRNKGKLAELEVLLASVTEAVDRPIELLSAAEANVSEVEETGTTLLDNAVLKAATAFRETGQISLADDSGLAVEALDGAPGVMSARFAGIDVTYQENNQLLLKRMEGIADPHRNAAFLCTLALIVPESVWMSAAEASTLAPVKHPDCPEGGVLFSMEGRVEGRIATALAGHEGFGYDPLFYFPPLSRTFAELTREEKNTISHRASALEQLRDCLVALLTSAGT